MGIYSRLVLAGHGRYFQNTIHRYLLHVPSYLISTCHENSPLRHALCCGQDGRRGPRADGADACTHVASCDKSTLRSLHQQPVRRTRLHLHQRAIAIYEILLKPQRNQWPESLPKHSLARSAARDSSPPNRPQLPSPLYVEIISE